MICAWHIWILAALLLFIVEIFTSGFGVLCFAVGCVAAALLALLDAGINPQLIAFCCATFLAFILVRPILLRRLERTPSRPTNADALIGRVVTVTETIDPANGTGRVRVDGESWQATTDDNSVIPPCQKVVITRIDSIILTVKKQTP